MMSMIRRAILFLALSGAGLAALSQPAAAFYGSFWASCRAVHIYGGGQYLTAWCRRIDGGWTPTSISNCGGIGVRNDDGNLVCGSD